MPASEVFAVVLSMVEFALGVLLISGAYMTIVSAATIGILSLFTIITLLSATLLPIGDCGCFGDAFKLTPWETFFKNIVMLPMAYAVWRCSRSEAGHVRRDVVSLNVALVIPLALNLYSLRYLPIVDFLPYKVGVNLRDEIAQERSSEAQSAESVLIFRDLATGEELSFAIDDTECWANTDLEFVEARTLQHDAEGGRFQDFHLYDSAGEDVTEILLAKPGRVAWLCVNDAEALEGDRLQGVESLYAQYPAEAIVVVVASESAAERVTELMDVTPYYIDAMTLRSMMRARVGVVLLNSGVVELKINALDL